MIGECGYKMFDIFVTGPDLSLMDRLNAFGEGFQGMITVENTSCASRKALTAQPGFEHCRNMMEAVLW